MKMMAGVLVVTALLLSACGTPPLEGTAGAVEPAELRTSEQALRGNCSVSVECGDGTFVSCNGSSRDCSIGVTYYNLEYVMCNGTSSYCPESTGDCRNGLRCTTNSRCGMNGMCIQGYCNCNVAD